MCSIRGDAEREPLMGCDSRAPAKAAAEGKMEISRGLAIADSGAATIGHERTPPHDIRTFHQQNNARSCCTIAERQAAILCVDHIGILERQHQTTVAAVK